MVTYENTEHLYHAWVNPCLSLHVGKPLIPRNITLLPTREAAMRYAVFGNLAFLSPALACAHPVCSREDALWVPRLEQYRGLDFFRWGANAPIITYKYGKEAVRGFIPPLGDGLLRVPRSFLGTSIDISERSLRDLSWDNRGSFKDEGRFDPGWRTQLVLQSGQAIIREDLLIALLDGMFWNELGEGFNPFI